MAFLSKAVEASSDLFVPPKASNVFSKQIASEYHLDLTGFLLLKYNGGALSLGTTLLDYFVLIALKHYYQITNPVLS